MSICALVTGKLTAAPERKVAQSGRSYTRFRMAVPDAEGTHYLLGSAFSDAAQAVLLALGEGAAVSVSGALKVGIYQSEQGEARPNLSIVADAVLTLHERRRVDGQMAQARAARQA